VPCAVGFLGVCAGGIARLFRGKLGIGSTFQEGGEEKSNGMINMLINMKTDWWRVVTRVIGSSVQSEKLEN
jgi:hypothetical protein